MPRRFRVTLSDETEGEADRVPTVTVAFEIREARIKCHSVQIDSVEGQLSIKSSLLQELNIDQLGIDAAASLALEYKTPGAEEVVPAQLRTGRAAAKELADGVDRLSRRELMHIGYNYHNPANSKAPTQAVQKAMGYGSRHTAIRRVKEARAKEWVLPEDASEEQSKMHFLEIQRQLGEL